MRMHRAYCMLETLRNILTRGGRRQTSQGQINRLINYQSNKDLYQLTVPPMEYLAPDAPADGEMCDRLIKAYQRATEEGGVPPDGLWKGRSAAYHQRLSALLLKGDHKGVAGILAVMFRDPVTAGLALGRDAYLSIRADDYQARLDWHDKVIALGQACGVIPVQNPEQGEYGTLLANDSLDILRRTMISLSMDPAPPQVGGMFGVRFEGKIIPINHLLHLYTAHRIASLVPLKQAHCLEIGGGVGLLAYAASSVGVRSFCIIDLPLVNVLQGYLLCRSDLANSVQLFGEDREVTNPRIRVLPNHRMDLLNPKEFDIVINQDSLPEMATETMHYYLRAITGLSSRYFLSINQEAQAKAGPDALQGWVHEACRSVPDLDLMYRAPYWMRKGYVEELYRIVER